MNRWVVSQIVLGGGLKHFTRSEGINLCKKYGTGNKSREDGLHVYWRGHNTASGHCNRKITSIYQPMNAHISSHKTLLKYFKIVNTVT